MEEHEAHPESPPPGRRKRAPFSPEQKQAILAALAGWTGTRKAFCLEHKVHTVTLWEWEKAKGGKPRRPAKKAAKTLSVYTPEQRRQAVEAFNKSGRSLDHFGFGIGMKLSGLHASEA